MVEKIDMNDVDLKKKLSSEQFHILREKGTEKPFTGKYLNNKEKGLYLCAACGNKLFSSEAKYDSKSGWPSFWEPIQEDNVETVPDNSLGMKRMEIKCSRCGSHLGHVFDDGPQPTGKRYCVNSMSLEFRTKKEEPYVKV